MRAEIIVAYMVGECFWTSCPGYEIIKYERGVTCSPSAERDMPDVLRAHKMSAQILTQDLRLRHLGDAQDTNILPLYKPCLWTLL